MASQRNPPITSVLDPVARARPVREPGDDRPVAQRWIGWREWVALPQLGIRRLAAKTDTGARTSSLHAIDLVPSVDGSGRRWLDFRLFPLHGDERFSIACRAPIVDERDVRSSNGQRSRRYVIRTVMVLGAHTQTIELTLADRGPMNYGMLLGRLAIAEGGWLIDCRRGNIQGRPRL